MKNNRNWALALAGVASLSIAACDQGAPEGDATIETAAEESGTLASAIGADSTLGKAVEQAGLADVFAGPGPYTVLAPTDAAFEALPAGGLDALMADDAKEQLGQVLTYHVLPGAILGEDLAKAIEAGGGSTEVPTLGGATLTAKMDGDTLVFVDAAGGEARVGESLTDLDNGVVHRLDAVLMPN